MKIWIHLNGLQQGPYDLQQLVQLPIDASTPVWYDGLAQWTAAGVAPATAGLFDANGRLMSPATNIGAYAQAPGYSPAPGVTQVFVQQQPQYQPRPSTYIGWSILLTVLCCSPIALLGIVTGAISSSRYNSGDVQGARRMSNLTEWLLIFSIVFAFITGPLGWTMAIF